MYNVNCYSIFHIETAAQHSRMLFKRWVSVHTQSGFTDISTCIHKYYSPKDVECYMLQHYIQNIMCSETSDITDGFQLIAMDLMSLRG